MPKSFYFILICLFTYACEGYEVKNGQVYYKDWNEAHGTRENIISKADAQTFEILGNEAYARDKNYVFYQGQIIHGADPESFEPLEGLFAIDKERAYYSGDSIEGASSRDFKVLERGYSADYKDIYLQRKPLHVCSVEGFKFIEATDDKRFFTRWSTDGCHYFYLEYKVPSEDYEKIKIYPKGEGFSTDGTYIYFCGRNIMFNKEGERILDTVDLATFEVDGIDCRDKFGCINVFHGRKFCE